MIHRKTMLLIALVLLGVIGFGVSTPAAVAADNSPTLEKEKPAKGAMLSGKIASVDLDNSTFVITSGKGDKAKEVTVTFNGDTKFMLGKEDSTSEAVLTQGETVRVKHKDGVAEVVTRQVKKPKQPKPDEDQ